VISLENALDYLKLKKLFNF